MHFTVNHNLPNSLARAGTLVTDHGVIETPAFVTVGTKATVKALTPEDVVAVGGQVVLANTYHLYLQPGEKILRQAGGLHKFMNWSGPTMTDSGGFQVFSLGAAFGTSISKLSKASHPKVQPSDVMHLPSGFPTENERARLVKINEDGVTFRSHIDGSEHRFTPERSMEMQHNIGADIMFAFDECTSPTAPYEYQVEAMERTHRWAARSLAHHTKLAKEDPLPYSQALFGIVQGGRHQDLREASARFLSELSPQAGGFDGFGIGGSFDKEDMGAAVRWVNSILPEEKPRHLLGIGEPGDLFDAVENGCDLFDCVAATRMARSGTLYTSHGRINIMNTGFRSDFSPIDPVCECSTCVNPHASGRAPYTPNPARGWSASPASGRPRGDATGVAFSRAYLAHLFRANELLAYQLASIHNLSFIIHLVKKIRQSLFDDTFFTFKESFLRQYAKVT